MKSTSEHPIDRAFAAIERLIDNDAALAPLRDELSRSATSFGSEPTELAARHLWRRRLLEWFVLERPSDRLRVPPLDELLELARARGERDPQARAILDAAPALRGSLAGLFEVSGVEPERGMWISDLGARGEYPVSEPSVTAFFHVGDLIAGRTFPLEEGAWHLSRAAAFFRSAQLRDALRSDIERARAQRRGAVRISQLELERMFFGRERRTPKDAVGEARALLLAGGVERETVDEILAALAQAPFDRARIVHGVDDHLSEVLDRLAFDTSIDLDQARRALVHAWEELATRGPGKGAVVPRTKAPTSDVSRALADFEDARKRGVSLERAFQDLEADLDLADEPGEDDLDAVAPAPDFPGVVGAIVDEFLWERENVEGTPTTAAEESLRLLSRFAAPIGVFENFGERDLLAYTCHWLPESGALTSADAALAHLGALSSFCRWAEETQAVPLHSAFKSVLQGLANSLPRIVEANLRRTREADPASGELYECLEIDRSRMRVRNRGGDELEVEVDPELSRWLRPGDHLRARVHDDGKAAVYCCYPPEARALVAR